MSGHTHSHHPMNSKFLIALPLILGLASFAAGQNSYSESTAYRPRESAKTKKELKADKEEMPAAPIVDVVSDDIAVSVPVSILDRTGRAIGGITKQDVSVFVDDVEV